MEQNIKILFVDDDPEMRTLVSFILKRAGYEVELVESAAEAFQYLTHSTPNLILSDVMMADSDGFTLLDTLRKQEATRHIPVILLTALAAPSDLVKGLSLGADDYIQKPFQSAELLARIQSKINRPPMPSELVPMDIRSGLVKPEQFEEEFKKEFFRSLRNGSEGFIAFLSLSELAITRERVGMDIAPEIWKQAARSIAADLGPTDVIGLANGNLLGIILPDMLEATAHKVLVRLTRKIMNYTFVVGNERFRLTPSIGYANFLSAKNAADARNRALTALDNAIHHLDMEPRLYEPSMGSIEKKEKNSFFQSVVQVLEKLILPFQIGLTFLIGIILPYFIYRWMDFIGYDITPVAYMIVTISLVLTALLIWVEGFYALRKNPIPEPPGAPSPPATAVIAAYLPNEGATIVDTIEAFLRLDYPAPLQIILAYNSPYEMPIERDLKEIAARDPRFVPFRVSNSTSKAQNINTVIAKVTGEFIGIFDADHHPNADSFTRAWHWLSNGYSIVQGHCAVRNGDSSWVSRLVAVEFEAIYAISHPGRARLHQFGIFGGSNGFWKVDLLRQTRMHGFMLTEDIDSSIRVTMDGVKIASDPDLISRELAPTNLKTLWNQRMRWAQGWHQVSLKHLLQALASKKLTVRQKFGAFWLLGWREAYPWLSMQMFPIILFWIQKYHGVENINWLIPIFVMATLFTLSVGPGQVFFSYRLSLPEIKQHKGWFVFYFIVTSLVYTEFKNTIGRVAQIKELFKERQWKVTPRSAPQPPHGQSRFVSR
ncbi:MAG TPA: response regulator [Anaerolineales bacterium]|nr:response regulator [Anaerolineales bacterium]